MDSHPRGLTRLICACALAALGLLGVALWTSGDAAASEKPEPAMRYIAVTGDGPTARAWYDGAAPSGVPVQEALDIFAAQGFQVADVSRGLQTNADQSVKWSILLARKP